MGTTRGTEVKFNCACDCVQTGCPGHTLRTDSFRTADVVNVFVDGKLAYTFDDAEWDAMWRSSEGWAK